MTRKITIILVVLGVFMFMGFGAAPVHVVRAEIDNFSCEKPGWFPSGFGLKDHSVFEYAGYYYIVSISVPNESRFAYARSLDFCTWEDMSPIMTDRPPNSWEENAIWAPFVFEENGVYYMYYTGVANKMTQSIMVAITTDPSDPFSWQLQGMVFQPNHIGMVWMPDTWADCRDAMIFKLDGVYYLYYTGQDVDDYIIGVATASAPMGPWYDWGRMDNTLTGDLPLESPTAVQYGSVFYMFYHWTNVSEVYAYSPGPTGPWVEVGRFQPGWAHEVWQDQEGNWKTSYLTNYSVSISDLTWDHFIFPARPIIGSEVYHLVLPLVVNHP